MRILAHPLVALPLWAINLYAWHVPALHEAAVHHSGIHALQHLLFITLGANMWMCLFGPLPKPAWFGNLAQLGYIISVRLAGAILANIFVFGGNASTTSMRRARRTGRSAPRPIRTRRARS